jgi:hypothetical protein
MEELKLSSKRTILKNAIISNSESKTFEVAVTEWTLLDVFDMSGTLKIDSFLSEDFQSESKIYSYSIIENYKEGFIRCICTTKNTRFVYKIINTINGNILSPIGNDCIKIIDKNGTRLNQTLENLKWLLKLPGNEKIPDGIFLNIALKHSLEGEIFGNKVYTSCLKLKQIDDFINMDIDNSYKKDSTTLYGDKYKKTLYYKKTITRGDKSYIKSEFTLKNGLCYHCFKYPKVKPDIKIIKNKKILVFT